MYCTNCGTGWSDTATFCGVCGTRLPAASAGAQAPPPVEYPPSAEYPAPAPPAPARGFSLRRHERAITVAVVVVVGVLAVAGWQAHWPPAVFGSASAPALTWHAAQAPLPADATRSADQDAVLNDVSCTGASTCVAVGLYSTGSNADTARGLIETLSGGTWRPAAAPFTVPDVGTVPFVNLDGIACPTMGSCVAVGSYFNSGDIESPLIERRAGSTWTSARPRCPPTPR